MFTVTEEALIQPHGNPQTPSENIIESHVILAAAREAANQAGLRYAGNVSPQEAWQLFSRRVALLIDVRTAEELKFVGFVPDSLHVAWMTGVNFLKNPNFLRELESKASRNDVILFLCRSGTRSVAAAEAVTRVGFRNVFNVLEGFEGDLEDGKRGIYSGWRSHGLPWVQD
jgi:rhodanese-related sulfurtransferase